MSKIYLNLVFIFLSFLSAVHAAEVKTEINCNEKLKVRGRELDIKTILTVLGENLSYVQKAVFKDGEVFFQKQSELVYQKDLDQVSEYSGKIMNSDTELENEFIVNIPVQDLLISSETVDVKTLQLIVTNFEFCHDESCFIKKWNSEIYKNCKVTH